MISVGWTEDLPRSHEVTLTTFWRTGSDPRRWYLVRLARRTAAVVRSTFVRHNHPRGTRGENRGYPPVRGNRQRVRFRLASDTRTAEQEKLIGYKRNARRYVTNPIATTRRRVGAFCDLRFHWAARSISRLSTFRLRRDHLPPTNSTYTAPS